MAGYTNQILAALLLGLAASSCSARQLLVAAVNDEPSGFVAAGVTRSIMPSLALMLETLQHDTNLMEAALKCSEATGIPDVTGALPEVLFGAIDAFAKYGFCGLPSQKEQIDRLSYMVTYSVSIHLRDTLQDNYKCEGMKGLPSECGFGTLVAGAVEAAAVHYHADPFCVNAPSDGTKTVELLTLPEGWKATAPAFKCESKSETTTGTASQA